MKPRRETDSQQLIALLREVLAIANRLSTRERVSSARLHKGIFAHQSKYNPWRAYDSGKPVVAGPQAAALRVVAK